MSRLPSPRQFFLETPPYHEFSLGQEGYVDLLRLQFYADTLDTYCLECKRESVFRNVSPPLRAANHRPGVSPSVTVEELLAGEMKAVWPFEIRLPPSVEMKPRSLVELEPLARVNRVFLVQFACTRDDSHWLFFIFRVQDDKVVKIGQSPSLADLQAPGVKKYRKLLGDERFRELTRAIGLHAHGVGIGAFVYLRRIFEDLISAAQVEAATVPGWDQEAFDRGRMDDKILLLKDFLPAFLVDNRVIYSILSKGIHTLTEEECLRHFDAVKVGIELILDEQLARRERQEKIARTAKALAGIKGELATGGT
jgi:hypothetical protein